MACAALKRPHNFDILAGGSPEQLTGSPKRRRCGVLMSNSPNSLPVSPFLEATPKVCRDELSRNVQDEWRRIQRRRRVASPASPPNNLNFQTSSSCNNPTPSNSTHWLSSMGINFTGNSSPYRGLASPGSMSPPRGKEQPSLTLKQVAILCERLWKEREEKLRAEYDQVLNDRLSEQYDSFLKFTQDQIMRKYQQSSCSYVS